MKSEQPPRCVACKGSKNLCGEKCRYLSKVNLQNMDSIGEELYGSSPPAVFVGRYGYPKVNLGPMLPVDSDKAEIMDSSEDWFGMGLEDLVSMRSSLVRSNFSSHISKERWKDNLLDITQEVAMSDKPVDTEVRFKKSPKPTINLDAYVQPSGPVADIEDAEITENPSVPRNVEYLVGDDDVRAQTAIKELYEKGASIDQEIRLLSAGLLGQERRRKLVPTRWSITAVDSNVGNELIDKLKDFQQLGEVMAGYTEYMDNRCIVLMIPDAWSFEFVEIFLSGSLWSGGKKTIINDWEGYEGRTSYADTTAGAYYAARLVAAERLIEEKRQAKVITIREIGEGYFIPLGVWIVRETMRKAAGNLKSFEDLEKALEWASSKLKSSKRWEKRSELLRRHKIQTKLSEFY